MAKKQSLPHGMGLDLLIDAPLTPESLVDTPTTSKKRKRTTITVKDETEIRTMTLSSMRRILRSRKGREDGVVAKAEDLEDIDYEDKAAKRGRASRRKVSTSVNEPPKTRKPKAPWTWFNKDPFPDHNSPTHEQCEEVHRILTITHGPEKAPAVIPPPSFKVAGCGEVRDVLDAMLRTKISANTSMTNAGYAIQDVKAKFGIRKVEGSSLSINWDAVHKADEKDLEKALRRGGLAPSKSSEIKEILERVYKANVLVARAKAMQVVIEQDSNQDANVIEAETQKQNDYEFAEISETFLTLDHLLELDTPSAIKAMMLFKGIGIKTAACVVLFCFQRPSFAVDTHVQRLCQYLGWVPENADAELTYAHCELRVPDHLKYGLHQLFLKHGKSCGKCRKITSSGTAIWDNTECPLEHLVKRNGSRKDGSTARSKKDIEE